MQSNLSISINIQQSHLFKDRTKMAFAVECFTSAMQDRWASRAPHQMVNEVIYSTN